MLRLDCPWCGARDETEFRWGGPRDQQRPPAPEAVDDATWSRYLYERENLHGVSEENWVHSAGCRRWFSVTRSTSDHVISASAPLGPPVLADPVSSVAT